MLSFLLSAWAKADGNDIGFETESMPPVKLADHAGYNMRFLSDDGLTEIYITDKK